MFVDLKLARLLETAEAITAVGCARAQARLRPQTGAEVQPVAGGMAVFVGVGSALTHAVGMGLQGPVSAGEMDDLEAFFSERGSPVNIDLCPFADPSLFELLGTRGYRIVEFNNVLFRTRDGVVPAAASSDVVVSRAEASDEQVWARTVAEGFLETSDVPPEAVEIGRVLFHLEGSVCYLGRTGGQPIGAGAMALRDGVANLFGDSTLTSGRRRGTQAALIAARTSDALAAGCMLAFASTLPGSSSQRNYERAGYVLAYTKPVLTREWE
jgi:hypothetical protein